MDTERGVVEILSYYNKKIYSYSLDGRFIGDRNGINACSFIKRSNGNYWLCKGVTADEQIGNEQIYEVDKQNKVIRKYLPLAHTLHAGIPEKSFSVGDDQSVLYFLILIIRFTGFYRIPSGHFLSLILDRWLILRIYLDVLWLK